MTIELNGSYAALKSWLDACMARHPNMALMQLDLQASESSTVTSSVLPGLAVRVRFRLFGTKLANQ